MNAISAAIKEIEKINMNITDITSVPIMDSYLVHAGVISCMISSILIIFHGRTEVGKGGER